MSLIATPEVQSRIDDALSDCVNRVTAARPGVIAEVESHNNDLYPLSAAAVFLSEGADSATADNYLVVSVEIHLAGGELRTWADVIIEHRPTLAQLPCEAVDLRDTRAVLRHTADFALRVDRFLAERTELIVDSIP